MAGSRSKLLACKESGTRIVKCPNRPESTPIAKVAQVAETFGMSDATIYSWLKQEKIDRGEIQSTSTDQALELATARRRIKQLDQAAGNGAGGLAQGQRRLSRRRHPPKALPVIQSLTTGQSAEERQAAERARGSADADHCD